MKNGFWRLRGPKFGGAIFCAGTAAATFISTQTSNVSSAPNVLKVSDFGVKDDKLCFVDKNLQSLSSEARIIRKIPSLITDSQKLELRLFQFQTCPFCCKVRAFLDYYGFGYEVVEVNSVTKREIKFSDYKKVPILVVKAWDGKFLFGFQQLNDSSFIVSFLRTFFVDPNKSLEEIKSFYPIFVVDESIEEKHDAAAVSLRNDNKYFVMFNEKLKTKSDIASRKEEREWRRWVDESLVHTISPNIYRTFGESLASFHWFAKAGDWQSIFPVYERLFIQYVGAFVMYFVGKKLKNKHNLKPDVRESLYDACNEWMKAIGQHRKFMGGDKPNLADLAVYGVLTSFEGCAAFSDLLANTKISPWFLATKSAVIERLGALEFGEP